MKNIFVQNSSEFEQSAAAASSVLQDEQDITNVAAQPYDGHAVQREQNKNGDQTDEVFTNRLNSSSDDNFEGKETQSNDQINENQIDQGGDPSNQSSDHQERLRVPGPASR